MVEQDSHLRGGKSAAGGVFKYGAGLLKRDAREQLDELPDRYSVFEVLEQGSDWHACTAEYPSPADAFDVALDGGTAGPVKHAADASTEGVLRRLTCQRANGANAHRSASRARSAVSRRRVLLARPPLQGLHSRPDPEFDLTADPQSIAIMQYMRASLLARSKEVRDDGSIVEVVIWELPQPLAPCVHSFKYRLFYGTSSEERVRYDNERGKGDHRHVAGQEVAYVFSFVDRLLDDFERDIQDWSSS